MCVLCSSSVMIQVKISFFSFSLNQPSTVLLGLWVMCSVIHLKSIILILFMLTTSHYCLRLTPSDSGKNVTLWQI